MGPELLPSEYKWLAKLQGPRLIVEGVKLFGLKEVPGKKSNTFILQMAKDTGLDKVYVNDGIAWCGLTLAYQCLKAEKEVPIDPLWAKHWAWWGVEVDKGDERLGDVMVWDRYDKHGNIIGGHVSMPVAQDRTHWHIMGGNQSDTYMIVRKPKSQKVWCRRPNYHDMPKEAQLLRWVTPTGAPSSKKEV